MLTTHLARKAEALHLADRTSEALEAINEAVAIAERFEHGYCSAELHRLRGVFLATLGADATQIEASFCEAERVLKAGGKPYGPSDFQIIGFIRF